MANSSLELRSAFLLLDQYGTGEIDISVIKRLCSLTNPAQYDSIGTPSTLDRMGSPISLDKSLNDTMYARRRSKILKEIKMRMEKKDKSRKYSAKRSKPSTKSELGDDLNNTTITQDLLNDSIITDTPEPPLRTFPNGTTKVDFKEFSAILNQISKNSSYEEELLLQIFMNYDTTLSGYLSPKSVVEIFKTFNQEISLRDAQVLMKRMGCKDEKMTFKQFKEFFSSIQ